MPFSARYLYDGGFFSISSSYRGLSFTNFDSVYFRFDLTLFTFRLLNFVIDTPSYRPPARRPSAPQENQCLLSHFPTTLGTQEAQEETDCTSIL